MTAPTNSEESNMAIDDFEWTVPFDFPPTPLASPRFSPLRLPQSPPRHLLPLSRSPVMYQGSSQSMENQPQNQQQHEEDIVDQPPYLDGNSRATLQKYWRDASDSNMLEFQSNNPGYTGISQRNSGESDMSFEDFEGMTTCFSFPSPTYFPPLPPSCPLYLPPLPSSSNSTAFWARTFSREYQPRNHQAVPLALFVEHIVEDLQSFRDNINQDRGIDLYLRTGAVAEDVAWLVENIFQDNDAWDAIHEATLMKIDRSEQHDEDIVDQPVFEMVDVTQQLIQNRGGELDVILGGGVFTINRLKYSDGHGLPTTPKPSVICQSKLSIRVWLGHGGQWIAEIRYGWNLFNIGSFKTVDGATLTSELVARWSGRKENRAEQTVAPRTGIPLLPLSQTAQEENLDEDFRLVESQAAGNDKVEGVETGSEGTWDYVMADQAQLNSRCLRKRKTKQMNPERGRRNNKTNEVGIEIPLEDVLQTKGMLFKDAAKHMRVSQSTLRYVCREYGIPRWPPRKFMNQSHRGETPVLVVQEGIPNLCSDQALTATVDTNSVIKEIPPPLFLPIARQENLDKDFSNDEAQAVGMGSEGTVEELGRLNSRYLGKGKRKKEIPGRGERGNNKITGVRIAIPFKDILHTKGMVLKDAAKHLKVSRSTLKRACREYNIHRWPPRNIDTLIRQFCPNESPMVVDQGRIPRPSSDTLLPSNQVSATNDINTVTVMARYGEVRIKFRLSWPWRKVELEQQVKKRLPLVEGTYYVKYKDEDDGLTLIGCDEDLEDYISSSSPLGTHSIEVFLEPIVAPEFRFDQL